MRVNFPSLPFPLFSAPLFPFPPTFLTFHPPARREAVTVLGIFFTEGANPETFLSSSLFFPPLYLSPFSLFSGPPFLSPFLPTPSLEVKFLNFS